MTKKTISLLADEFRAYDWDGTLATLKDSVEKCIAKHGADASVEFYSYDGSCDVQIYVKREETDEEYQKRIEIEKVHAEHRERIERTQYEALKKKYGT